MEIRYSKQASKYLAKLNNKNKKNIINKIKKLPLGDVIKMQNDKYAYRLKIGGVRILFDIYTDYAFIGKIKPRGDVYK